MMRTILLGVMIMALSCGGSGTSDTARPEIASKLSTYLDTHFGLPGHEASWHGAIKRIEVKGQTAIAHTDLQSKNDTAKAVCGGVSGFVFANPNRDLSLENVQVFGASGAILIERNGPADRCE